MSTTNLSVYEWKDVPWRAIERRIFKLQTRIYRASGRGDVKAVRRLQKLLMRSRSARYLAVRRVTQDNRGKRTAGIDGVKELPPPDRMSLAENLRLTPKAKPVRRVWIPKPGSEERRPLGIPTMRDRAAQALAKLGLEPEWEARFEPNSYGFRPGRSCHDAIEAIFVPTASKAKWVLDADIAKCFDRINHPALLRKMNTAPWLRRIVRAWLRAGVMDGPTLFPTKAGTPQGGIISPLLANIALHGLETAIVGAYPINKLHRDGSQERWRPVVVRYADDFVVLHPSKDVIKEIQEQAQRWLADMGLELNPTKTRIVHTLNGNDAGFDFLGFKVRQFRVGKTHSGKTTHGKPIGFKLLIRPSKKAVARQLATMANIIQKNKSATQENLIRQMNPIIRGWATYYATVSSKEMFNDMDNQLYLKLHRWAVQRHPRKSKHWIASKYWNPEQGSWTFAAKDGFRLREYAETPIRRHAKVRDTKSVFDGDWVYWASRLGRHPTLPESTARLLKRQSGTCGRCGLYFKDGDILERDHVVPLSRSGNPGYANQMLLHGHCHDSKSAMDATIHGEVAIDKAQVVEEPDEGKLSRPVLKTSRQGDLLA